MKFLQTPLEGAFVIDLEKREDERGFFARAFCVNEFKNLNLDGGIVQVNNSMSVNKGTLRGMHYQLEPYAETKIVRCVKGSLFDVLIDLRKASPTFGKWYGEVLSADNRRMMYVPKGFAHGFLTLESHTEAVYFVTQFYHAASERGLRFNDPAFKIEWPISPEIVSEKDLGHPDFNEAYHLNNVM
jgi:dTDP-4-dehydrorhamnose 3,5-epimerase